MTEKSSINDNKKLWSQKRLQFKDKRLNLPENPRKDNCVWCKKGVGDEYIDSRGRVAKIKRMHIHHEKYHNDDPVKDTITLCPSCHRKEEQRLKKLKEGIRSCSICKVTQTTVQVKRFVTGKTYTVQRWMHDPENKKNWVCFKCYNKIVWRLSKRSI
jgi:hypothetical protein